MTLKPVQPGAALLGNPPDHSLVRARRPNQPLPFESSHICRDRADRPEVRVPRDLSMAPGAAFRQQAQHIPLEMPFCCTFHRRHSQQTLVLSLHTQVAHVFLRCAPSNVGLAYAVCQSGAIGAGIASGASFADNGAAGDNTKIPLHEASRAPRVNELPRLSIRPRCGQEPDATASTAGQHGVVRRVSRSFL